MIDVGLQMDRFAMGRYVPTKETVLTTERMPNDLAAGY
jgi:hypothetical protein